MVVFPSLPLQGPGTMGKSQVQVNIRWLIYWCGHGGEGKHGTGGLRHTQTLKIAHLPCKTRDGTSFKWWQHPFSQMKTRPDWRLALGKAPDQVPEAQATSTPPASTQVPWKAVEPCRVGAGWAIRGRQSPIVLSTAHRFIQEPRVKCTSGSRVDSALNSFGITGRATEATGSGVRGGVTTPWRRVLVHSGGWGRRLGQNPY